MNFERTQNKLRQLALIIIFVGVQLNENRGFMVYFPQFTIDNTKIKKIAVAPKDNKWVLFYEHKNGGGEIPL